MSAVTIGLILTDLIVKHGIPLGVQLLKTWTDNLNGREPDEKDFEKLRVADPETFFKK